MAQPNWADRLKQAGFIAPNGDNFTFDYEDLSRITNKKTTVFEFPDKPGAFVQDRGPGARNYPMRVFLSGTDYDLDADALMRGLEQTGVGRLLHPIYGIKNVVTEGKIVQRDAVKTAGNQASFEVNFWETIISFGGALPVAVDQNTVTLALDETDQISSEQYAAEDTASKPTATVIEVITAKTKMTALVDAIQNNFAAIVKVEQSVRSSFDATADIIRDNIDTLIGNPLELALKMVDLLREPARVAGITSNQIEGYQNMLATLLVSPLEIVDSYDNTAKNTFTANRLAAAGVLIAFTDTLTNTSRFTAKAAALNAAAALLAALDDYTVWVDNNIATVGLIDTGETYQALYSVVVLAATNLVAISFDLAQERVFTLDRQRNLVELSVELFQSLEDDKLNELINTNNLSSDEIIELPLGREIRYYV